MRGLALALALWLGLLAAPAAAAERLALDGKTVQGGLVLGRTEPGARVVLDGRRVRVDGEGRFVLGFGRDHPPEARLSVELPDGKRLHRHLEVRQRDYRVERIDGLPRRMVTPPPDVLQRIREENARIAEARARDRAAADFAGGFAWPATGPVTGVYGSQRVLNGKPRRPHYGVDIAAPAGSPVRAPAGGVVTLAEAGMYFTGGTVILDHGHGLTSAFLHLQSLAVEKGEHVAQGEVIGRVGASGRATGPHLDWRVNWFDRRLDPALLAGEMPEP